MDSEYTQQLETKHIPWNKGKTYKLKKGYSLNNRFNKGYIPWNTGRKDLSGILGKDQRGENNPFYGKKHTPEAKEKMKLAKLGKMPSNIYQLTHPTKEQEAKRKASLTGRKSSMETRRKLSESHKGEKSYLWKGGVTPINHKIRMSFEYNLWRTAVFTRDNFQCVNGGNEHGNRLEADHIKPFSLYPELRLAIDNGRTLCKECHRKTATFGRRMATWIAN